MKVVLLKDFPKIGKAGEVKDVSDGYGRNFLIPRGIALEATESELARLKAKKREIAQKEERIKSASEELLHKISQYHFNLKVKAGASGKLFGAVTSADIADIISKTIGEKIDKHYVDLKDNIKQTGDYKIALKLPGGVKGNAVLKIDKAEEE